MKIFLRKIVLIGGSIWIMLIIADISATKHYRQIEQYPFSTWTDIVEGKLDSDVWFLGSSRTLVQYNPIVFDSIMGTRSYTLGCDAQHIFLQLQCCDIARQFNTKPQYIVLDLLWQSLDTSISELSRYIYMPYLYNRTIRNIVIENGISSPAYLYVPYYRFHSERNNALKYCKNKTIRGYEPKDDSWSPIDLDGLDNINYHCEPEAISLLDSFLNRCSNDSIKVIIIHSPFERRGFEKIKNHDEMLNLFRSIANRHGIPFLDYTNDPICYDTLNFYNAMHLNSHGADLFSAKLAHDLDSLGLIPARK
ncbi:MAG: hypothetical protein K5864_01185 [Bacteroidales bacterium]|nr:hypothetical protein [Bacteroidales bacterium]